MRRAIPFLSFFCCLIISCCRAQEGHSIMPIGYDVFASSFSKISPPIWAVDSETSNDQITCYRPLASLSDRGRHWLLLDLGRIETNVTAIDILLKINSNQHKPTTLNIRTAEILGKIPKLETGEMGPKAIYLRRGLKWEMFVNCTHLQWNASESSSTSNSEAQRQRMTCDQPRNARWLLFDQSAEATLEFCSLSVVIQEAAPNCFVNVSELWDMGSYRQEQGARLPQCQLRCHEDLQCEAIEFVLGKWSRGSCLFFRTLALPNTSKSPKDCAGGASGCVRQQNRCHQGKLNRLYRIDQTNGLVKWKISPYILRPGPLVITVHFKGRIICPSMNCGSIRISFSNSETQEELFCTLLDPQRSSRLNLLSFSCANKYVGKANQLIMSATREPLANILVEEAFVRLAPFVTESTTTQSSTTIPTTTTTPIPPTTTLSTTISTSTLSANQPTTTPTPRTREMIKSSSNSTLNISPPKTNAMNKMLLFTSTTTSSTKKLTISSRKKNSSQDENVTVALHDQFTSAEDFNNNNISESKKRDNGSKVASSSNKGKENLRTGLITSIIWIGVIALVVLILSIMITALVIDFCRRYRKRNYTRSTVVMAGTK